MPTERKVIMAAIKSRPECNASDKTPRLPVRTTRKAFNATKSPAETTLRSAARFFSRASIGASISIAGLDYPRFCILPGFTRERCAVTDGMVILTPSRAAGARVEAAWPRRARRGLPLRRREERARQEKQASHLQVAPIRKRS